MILRRHSHLLLLQLWCYSIVINTTTTNARRPWSLLPTIKRHGKTTTQRSNFDVADSTVPLSLSSTNDASTVITTNTNTATCSTGLTSSEYIVVCILKGVGVSTNSSSSCILIEKIIPSIITTIQQQQPLLRYHYYSNILKSTSSSFPSEAFPILWRSIGLLSDVIVISIEPSRVDINADDHVTDSDMVHALVTGLQQRRAAQLSPSSIYILVSSTSEGIMADDEERAQQLYCLLQNATTPSELVQNITILYNSTHNDTMIGTVSSTTTTNHANNVLPIIDIPIPTPQKDGTHIITDCTSFIHVFHETMLRSVGSYHVDESNLLHAWRSYNDMISDDVTIIESVPLVTDTLITTDIISPSNTTIPHVVQRDRRPWKFPILRKPKIPILHNPIMMRFRTSNYLQNILKRPTTKYKMNELSFDALLLELDRIQEQLHDIQNQQEDYVVSVIDSSNPNVVTYDLISIINPILNKLHAVLASNRRLVISESLSSSSILDPMYLQQLITTIYEYQCSTILRNYYGTIYETLLDQQPMSSLNAKWIYSLQERIRDNYRRHIEQIVQSLEHHNNVIISSLSKKQHESSSTSLDINTYVTNFMTDIQAITELRIDLSTMMDDDNNDNSKDSSPMTMEDVYYPQRYKNRIRRQRIYRIGKNIMKRAAMIGINYIQGYIAIQSIKYIALQQEREMPKFPLF